jgi:6-phosphofructokinase 2
VNIVAAVKRGGQRRDRSWKTGRWVSRSYRFVLPRLPLRETEWRGCLEALAGTEPRPKFVVASGSLPPGVPNDFYAQAAAIARKLGAKFVVDTSGAPLAAAIEHGVYMIKPNLREMRDLVGVELLKQNDWIIAAREYISAGKVEVVALSLGHLGALLVTRDQALRAPPLPIKPVSAVGAGDSFLMAAGSAALINAGTELCRPEDVYRLYTTATIESL